MDDNGLLNFLGRDSGFGENNNSAYIEENENLILIDCGFTVFKQIKERFDLKKYNSIYVIITHLHNDHAGSLSQLILYSWYIYNKKITVISKCKKIEEYLDITGTPKEAYTLLRETKNIEFIGTEHVETLDSYGFKLNIKNKNIVYTGDTKILKPFIKYLEQADEFYVDVSRYGGVHLKIDEIINKLKDIQKMGVKVYLMHLDDIEYIYKIAKGL